MVFSQSSGILFTADPVTSNRKIVSIDASFGLGEAVVSGLVNPDIYKINNGEIVDKKISTKKIAIHSLNDGGIKEEDIKLDNQNKQVLTNEQILKLEQLGRKIEKHFGSPQDIEWCLVDNVFYIVQSRPITTLYPILELTSKENSVYISVGHQQMMTDAIKPLGLSLFQLTSLGPRFKSGGRLFVDVTQMLVSPNTRATLLKTMEQQDHLIKDALISIVERGDFIKTIPFDEPIQDIAKGKPQIKNDPKIIYDLIKTGQTFLDDLKFNIQTKSGVDLFEFILEDIQ